MKRFAAATAFLALAGLSGSAGAQPPADQHGGHAAPPSAPHPGGPPGGHHGPSPSVGFHGAPPSAPHEDFHHGPPSAVHPPGRHDWNGHGSTSAPENTHVTVNVHETYAAPGGRVFQGSRGYGEGFHRGGHFSYRGRSFPRFHVRPFVYPAGWGYRSWTVGTYLPALFFAPNYFIGEWNAYDLGPPPPGYHWVRYGPDALLVGPDGRIADVVRGVFWW